MNENEITFDIFAEDTEQTKSNTSNTKRDETCMVEAIQIVRIVKATVASKKREVLDTIKVEYPKMTYERALKIAKFKAEKLGNCMVVEKLERIVGTY